MKKLAYVVALVVGLFTTIACQKDDEAKVIDPTKLTSYIWSGTESGGFSGSYLITYGVAYDFSIDGQGKQLCKKTYYVENRDENGYRMLSPHDYLGTWTLENNQVKIAFDGDIADHKIFNEVFDLVELTENKLVFKSTNEGLRPVTTERTFKSQNRTEVIAGN
ncbi:lipocalin family protein [Solitalea sp. MAHUQ-68]|uniref:Lipocalin family protein n=1 Tax=Solitalea agri TaxID=2953739 RepID=A0A9X2F4G4_9SPHI|nr:lipocalin family protein [Solitalea agri]MCO4292156.1 lipocalin family protein [Solitalea agri]